MRTAYLPAASRAKYARIENPNSIRKEALYVESTVLRLCHASTRSHAGRLFTVAALMAGP
jgi:hypothetical protein